MSQYQAGPRLGHLEVLYNVFAYLKKHKYMGKLVYDSKTPEVDESAFNNNAYWEYFCCDVEEELPPKMAVSPLTHHNRNTSNPHYY